MSQALWDEARRCACAVSMDWDGFSGGVEVSQRETRIRLMSLHAERVAARRDNAMLVATSAALVERAEHDQPSQLHTWLSLSLFGTDAGWVTEEADVLVDRLACLEMTLMRDGRPGDCLDHTMVSDVLWDEGLAQVLLSWDWPLWFSATESEGSILMGFYRQLVGLRDELVETGLWDLAVRLMLRQELTVDEVRRVTRAVLA